MWHDVEKLIMNQYFSQSDEGQTLERQALLCSRMFDCENTGSRDHVTASCCRPPDRHQHFHSHPNTDDAHNRLTEIGRACPRCEITWSGCRNRKNLLFEISSREVVYCSSRSHDKMGRVLEGNSLEFLSHVSVCACVCCHHGCKCTMNWIEIIKRQKIISLTQ